MRVSPLDQMFDRYGDKEDRSAEARQAAKEGLVKAVRDLVKKGDLLEDEFSDKGIERVSNKKLLKLVDLAEQVREDFGSRASLVDKLLEEENRAKDAGYRERVEGYSLKTLYDRYKAAKKRS